MSVHVCTFCVLKTDFHYEYTECDSNGGRWKVAVPNPETCQGGVVPAPVRGKSCGKFHCTIKHK